MKRLLLASVLCLAPAAFAAAPADLILPGERWIAASDKYVCSEDGVAVTQPPALQSIQAVFEQMTTDFTLDNALIKATFQENGKTCRYNAILFADNALRTAQLVQSIAFNPSGDAAAYRDCSSGKAVLDAAFKSVNYLYYGHPHSLAFMLPGVGAETVCGEGAEAVGVNFKLQGKIQ